MEARNILFMRNSNNLIVELDWDVCDLRNSRRVEEANFPTLSHPDSF
jgi:hypothetical protein